jgi:membrane-associated phospholipid phosphatase
MKVFTLAFVLSSALLSAAARCDSASPPGRPPELRQAVDVAVVTLVSVEALKRVVRDPRPSREGGQPYSGYGFPSGHAALAFGLARVASEYRPGQEALWYALAGCVAWSRVKRQAHDWDDVIGGALLGSWVSDTAAGSGGIVLKKWNW